jgi:glycogen synthase
MRIALVAARYSPFVGGIETHVHEVGTRMAALGHQVRVLTTDPSGALPKEQIRDGLCIRRLKAWPKNRDFYFSPRLYSEIRDGGYDIVHFQGYNTFVPPIGMTAALLSKIPYVLTFHSGGHPSRLRNAVRGIQRQVLSPLVKRAAHLIGVSQYEAEFFREHMGLDASRLSVVPNGAELPPPSDPRPAREPHLVLSIGRLERYKGHHRAIEAFPQLLKQIPDARLIIVGSGSYKGELQRLARNLTLSGLPQLFLPNPWGGHTMLESVPATVSFVSIPTNERQRLTDLLYQAGLVVLLSDYEAHPVSVMEALSVGRPVLVTDTTGLREIAQKGWCRSVPLDADSPTIAAAMAAELHGFSAAGKCLGAGNCTSAVPVSLPNWDDCTRQLLNIYEGVVH